MKTARTLEDLVEEQCQSAQLKARAMSVHPPQPGERWPVIAISSEAGAGGRTLGESVATSCAFAFWGPQLLGRVAEELHAVESVLADVDGHVSSSVTDFVRSLLVGLEYSQDEYVRALVKVVGRIGQRGAAVIIGHGAHLILGAERALRVRVVCPEPVRARRIVQQEGLENAAAERALHKRDHEAAAFIMHHFKKDIADPHGFDLVVNSGVLDVAQATELVRQAYRTKFGRLPGVCSHGRSIPHRSRSVESRQPCQ
jgi:cytidylate kinase